MKLRKILTPIAVTCSIGAVVTPMTTLVSCKCGGDGAVDVSKPYTPKFKPAEAKKYDTAALALDDYFDYAMGAKQSTQLETSISNGNDYSIIKDDVRYSYSQAFQTQAFKDVGELTSYTLDFKDIELNKTSKTLNCTFVVKVKGKFSSDWLQLSFTDGDFECEYHMDDAFQVEFCKKDDLTNVSMNYIKCKIAKPIGTATCKYTLKGSCKVAGETININQVNQSHTLFSASAEPKEKYGVVADMLILDGLTCNMKNPQVAVYGNYGIFYTNYMSLAEIK